jgi:UDP-galactopyranose mutase
MNPTDTNRPDLLCLSHLRWDFVFQRPQHLMRRFAQHRRVLFIEEAIFESGEGMRLNVRTCPRTNVQVITPHLPERFRAAHNSIVSDLLSAHLEKENVYNPIAWFYTPMALDYFPASISPALVVYDCMDELSLFKNAPPRLTKNEKRLMRIVDLVFTGGVSLFEHKRAHHPRVYPFPSGVDVKHFAQARERNGDFCELNGMPRPRIGYAGVIDERIDLDLIRSAAELRPDWQFVMIGPVVKIDPATLPQASNIHWVGMKDYRDLPSYFSGWDVAMMPFALNDSTRFISPTKTPEYLSAGLPVVSTAIRDVVRPYGELGLARIVSNSAEFVGAAEQAMQFGMSLKWRERADAFLQSLSWDSVWHDMNRLIHQQLEGRDAESELAPLFSVPEAARV